VGQFIVFLPYGTKSNDKLCVSCRLYWHLKNTIKVLAKSLNFLLKQPYEPWSYLLKNITSCYKLCWWRKTFWPPYL